MDATTPHGRAMLQMAAVFAELERRMIRERVMAGLARVRAEGKKTLGRPKVGRKGEDAIRARLSTGDGMLKVSKALGVGVSSSRPSCVYALPCTSQPRWRPSSTDIKRAIVRSITAVTGHRPRARPDDLDEVRREPTRGRRGGTHQAMGFQENPHHGGVRRAEP